MPDVAYCPECNQPVLADAQSCKHCGAEVGPGLDRADIWHGLRDKLAAATKDNYEVDGLIGYGGMAGVYLAKDTRLNRHVALKLITPAVLMDPKMVRRFRQEAQTMAQLNHRHIVPVYDIRESDDLLFIVMQYVPGRTLAEVVTDSKERLPPELVATWMIQISDALAHAHGRATAVIHRDIKPSNIILDETGEAQLTDFGIAKVQGDAGLTRTGHLIGTPAYMSPEQCRGGAITAASDQYSLGTVAYELLAGVPPFRGPTLMVLQAHSGEEPKKLSATRPECPPALAAVVERMLAKSPEDRWPEMAEVSRALKEAIGEMAPAETLQAWAKRVREIGLETKPTPLTLGTSERLIARLLDANGEELVGRRIHWASTDGGVATVTAEGVLGARGVGSAVIVGRSGAAVATLEVEVVPEREAVATLTITADQSPMRVGEERTATCQVLSADGTDLPDRALQWSSSDLAVLAVDASGKVVAVSEGSAVLTATCEEVSETLSVEVVGAKAGSSDHTQVIHGIDWGAPQDLRPPVTSEAPAFTEMPELAEPPAVGAGDDNRTRVLSADVKSPPIAPAGPPGSFDKTNVIRPGDLVSEEEADGAPDESAAGLQVGGRDLKDFIPAGLGPRVGMGAGAVVLLILLLRGLGGGADLPPLALSVLPGDTAVEVGDQFRLRAGVPAADLRARNPVWSSSDPGVAVVTEAGVVEAVGPGMAAISLRGDGIESDGPWALTVVPLGELVAAAPGDAGAAPGVEEQTPEPGSEAPGSDAATEESRPASPTPVPVERQADPPPPTPRAQPEAPVPSRLILDVNSGELDVGQGRLLRATVVDQNGRAMPSEGIVWSSTAPSAVTVGDDGTVSGVSSGSAWITAAQGSLRDSVELSVAAAVAVEEPPPAPSLGSSPTSAEAAALVAQFADALGGDPNRVLTWIPAGDRDSHERYVTFVSEERLEAGGDVQNLNVSGASARFTLPVRARTAFGGTRTGTMNFIAEFAVEGGSWGLVRVVPTPGSTPP